MNKNIALKIHADLHKAATETAKRKGISLSKLIRKSIEQYCTRTIHEEKHVAGQNTEDQGTDNAHANTEKPHEQSHETLRELISTLQQELTAKNKQIEEFLKQQDQGQQLAAMQQKTIDKLTEQNQLLLESSQEKEEKKVGFWGRLIGQRA